MSGCGGKITRLIRSQLRSAYGGLALQQRHLQMRHVWRETTPQNNLLVSVAAVAAPLLKSALAKRSATTRPSRWISAPRRDLAVKQREIVLPDDLSGSALIKRSPLAVRFRELGSLRA